MIRLALSPLLQKLFPRIQLPESSWVQEEIAPLEGEVRVFLHNDDRTPMEFVVQVLQDVFELPREKAVKVMLSIHYKGKWACGRYSPEAAMMKLKQVLAIAEERRHSLQCTMEKE